MTKTEHYQLNQWDAADPIRREDFNADNAAVDAALHSIQSEATEGLAALAAGLGSGGKNCRIAWGSYMGDGKYDSSNPNTLTFDFKPMLVYLTQSYGGDDTHFLRPAAGNSGTSYQTLFVTWTDHGLSWYSTGTQSSAFMQYNYLGCTYYYIAFGVDE